ncbi:MAG: haloacid dehalogenase [Saprospiraceae bacterium]|nr:MAG: haloacid dehalogenase [Saprospiraceae bacterium]
MKAIIFDAYGTLFNVNSIDERLHHYYETHATELAAIWRRKQLEYTWLRSLMGRYKDFYALTTDALQFAATQLQLEISEAITADLMARYYELKIYPEVKKSLQQLQQKYRLAILSNANPELLERAVKFNDIGSSIERIFSVHTIREYKPFPGVYDLPASGLQLKKQDLLFVSSNTWDVAGAKAAGLQVAWIQRKGGVMDILDQQPDFVFADLGGLLTIKT